MIRMSNGKRIQLTVRDFQRTLAKNAGEGLNLSTNRIVLFSADAIIANERFREPGKLRSRRLRSSLT